MNKYDSRNGIEHKCPCCGYEVEWDWDTGFVKGDESFIKILSPHEYLNEFHTDKPRLTDWGPTTVERVTLLGCPKCNGVSFKFN